MTIQSNAVAGGSLWSWVYNGTEFVNHYDYGREIQSDLFYGSSNPTEAGDKNSKPTRIVEDRHGSPNILLQNNGLIQSSRTIPLEWEPLNTGGTIDNPVLYKDITVGKNITLNWSNLGPVALYQTYLSLPVSVADAQLEVPTGYLNGNFNRYYQYDAVADSLVQVFPLSACSINRNIPFYPTYGGVIIADSSGTHAMGVFGSKPSVGGSVSYFTLWNFPCGPGAGTTSADGNTSKWDAVYGPATIPAGVTTYNSWIVSGTLAEVEQRMHSVYSIITTR